MSDDDLERLLSNAFDARARSVVPDHQVPPAPRFEQEGPRRNRRIVRFALPLTTAAAIVAVISIVLTVVGHGSGSGSGSGQADRAAGAGQQSATPGSSPGLATMRGHGAPVRISLLNAEHSIVGVGMPVIAYLSKKITDARALQAATTVTVDGKVATADWYVEPSSARRGFPYEAHLRPQHYWPAHSSVRVDVQTDGLTAGTGMRFANDVDLSFRTGASHIATVDDTTHRLTLFTDGKRQLSYPVSLGVPNTPTRRGIKVIMEKGASICMSGPGYDECGIKYTQRLTYDGEYLHAAPWNVANITKGVNSSNGCTNLLPNDAKHLYSVMRVGDVVDYPNADGPPMQAGSGFGDWDVTWSTWRKGGLAPTH